MHSFEDDQELDFVTIRAADAFDAPGMANWDKMQLLLDKEMPIAQTKKRFAWVLIPALLLLGFAGSWWYFQGNHGTTALENNPQQIPAPSQKTFQKPSQKTIQDSSVVNNAINSQLPTMGSDMRHSGKQKAGFEESPSILAQMGELPGPVQGNNSPTEKPLDINATSPIKDVNKSEIPPSNIAANSMEASTPTTTSANPNPAAGQNNNPASTANSILIKKPVKTNKGFFIGLTAGMDASTVHFNYKENLGYNIGGIIGYQFNKHFSIQTGGIYTQKNYKMNGYDFHPPKGTWVSYFKMETVSGSCDMWDVPLIGTYHFQYNGQGHYFLSLGTSSYFMKKEKYNYLYYVNNQTYNRSANYNSTDQHLFALVHVSGGIEKSMGKHVTGIIEPYAKIPMGGVGFGAIELSSFGVNFSLLYKQPKKK